MTTGPLGQGIANSVGMALAERLQATRFGKDLVDHYTYVFCGDGCLMEGISQEAISLAGHLKLGKLILFWDDNHISIDGPTELARHEDEFERFDASGWHTQRIDGHDTDAIADAIRKAQADDRPSMIACRTIIAFGAPTKANTAAAHGSPLGKEEIAGTRERLGWTSPPFVVPADMVEAWHEVGQRSKAASAAWHERLAKSNKRAEFEAEQSGEMPKVARDALMALRTKFASEAPKTATRQASGSVLDATGAGAAVADRRLGRSHAVQQHQGEEPEGHQPRRFRRQLHPLRHPRARHGRGDERHGCAWRHRSLWRHVPASSPITAGRRSASRR